MKTARTLISSHMPANPYPLAPRPYPLAPNLYSLSPAVGFSLFELLVVMVLLAIMTAVVYPSIGRGIDTIRLRTGSREIAALLRISRMKAVRELQVYWVNFDLDKNSIEVTSQDLRYQKTYSPPSGVTLRAVTAVRSASEEPERVFRCYFSPNGMSEDFEVWIVNKQQRSARIVQNSLTGLPRIEEVRSEAANP